MPKASVKEHRYSLSVEDKIRFAGKAGMPAPAVNPSLTQEAEEHRFRRCVPL